LGDARPIPIESRALGTLAYIRTSIESSGSMAVPARRVASWASSASRVHRRLDPRLAHLWLEIWLVAPPSHSSWRSHDGARGCAERHARYLGPVRKFLMCLCPALLAGAVLTFAMWRTRQRTDSRVWLLLYGCAVLSASTVTIPRTMRLICFMGVLFMLLGVLAFTAPVGFHTLILGLGFGGLHTIFGILIGR